MKKNKTINKIRKYLFDKEEIIFAYIYGSFLESNAYHDIDIGIYIDEKKVRVEDTFDYTLNIFAELSYYFGFPIDMKVINYGPLGFQKNVIRGKLLFSKDERLREEWVEEISLKYMEYYELSKQFMEEVLNG